MAFYLNRAFSDDPDLLVLNNLRLVDPQQPEHDGRDGVCQIEHLVLHTRGAFIIESKSVTGEIAVRADGSGGDEWVRRFDGRGVGISSPIQQARRQSEFLRAYLQRHREELLGRVPIGLRLVSRIASGTDQRGFRNLPMQIIVAISDRGSIRRVNGWKEPGTPFQTFLCKADLASEKILSELKHHREASALFNRSARSETYGLWSMRADELRAVGEFRHRSHAPAPADVRSASTPERAEPMTLGRPRAATPPDAGSSRDHPARAADAPAASCRHCGAGALIARWGQYGYYWKCATCDGNTPMPVQCSSCGAIGRQGRGVRIRKDGPSYFRHCEMCEREERIWTQEERRPPG